jgi:hypothetical protein
MSANQPRTIATSSVERSFLRAPVWQQVGALAPVGLGRAHLLAQRLGMHPEVVGDVSDRLSGGMPASGP